MKNFTFLFCLLISTFGYAQINLPIDFELPANTYVFGDFNGGVLTVEPNPDQAGINTSANVAKMVKGPGEVFGGSSMELAAPIDFSTQKAFRMKVWSPAVGTKVLFKVENIANGGIFAEVEETTTTAMTWEEMTFDLTGVSTTESFQKIVIIFENGTMGDGTAAFTYYIDDIEQADGVPGSGITFPVGFESTTITYDFSDFAGGTLTVEDNPDMNGNPSAKVAKMVKDGGDVFGGSSFIMNDPIDFVNNKEFKMKVWAPAVGTKVLLKVENLSNGGIFFEKEVLTTVASTWEELTFDFADVNIANSYQKIVIIFDNGTIGDGSPAFTYYLDDLELLEGQPIVLADLPITFDDPTIDYDLLDFEGGGPSTIVVDPTDPTNMVVQAVKGVDAGTSAGALVGVNGIANPIPFTAGNTTMSVRVWSPDAGIPVRLKVEDASDVTVSVETEATTTVAMAWETLTFDFSNEATGTAAINLANTYNKIAIFFNFGTDGAAAGEKIYFYDDIQFGDGGGGQVGITLPINFESTTINYVFGDFGGGVMTKETNPDQSGINTSMNVAKMVKNAPEPFGGSLMELVGPINFSTNKTFKMKVWAPAVGTKVLLKVENLTDGGIFFEQEEETTTASAWEELTFDFSAINTANSYQKVVLIFDNGTVGDGSAAFTYYVDDIELTTGGTTTVSEVDLPITFEDTMIDYDLTDFAGNTSSIVVDPTDPNNLVGQAIRSNTAETFAGTTMSDIGLANAIPFTATDTKMKVRVWSPDAGIQIRLKAEQTGVPSISVETEATTTVASSWETLEFDFSNEVMGTAALNPANTYDKITIFFNFGVDGATAGEKTYYWDDVAFGERITVVDVIVGSAVHNTLETAVIEAQLDDDLSGAGPFTVFAPTDDAFDNLDAGVLDALLLDPTGDLAQVLLYHVLGAKVLSSDLTNGQTATTLQGDDITVTITGGDIFINQALITTEDIETDNGVVHIIDAVLLIPVGIEVVNAAESGIIISPNPSSEFFNIEFPEELNEKVQMTLMDVNGKILKEGVITDRISQINVNDLNTGMYFLRMNTGEVSYFQKVMVSK